MTIQVDPPATPLPDEVLDLMCRTQQLIELLYWKPVPAKGSQGEAIHAQRMARRHKRGRVPKPDPTETIEGSSSWEEVKGRGPSAVQKTSKLRWQPPWPEGADLETRMAYGRALMSGYDQSYDPELFEDAFPLDNTPLYSEKGTVEAWSRGITSRETLPL